MGLLFNSPHWWPRKLITILKPFFLTPGRSPASTATNEFVAKIRYCNLMPWGPGAGRWTLPFFPHCLCNTQGAGPGQHEFCNRKFSFSVYLACAKSAQEVTDRTTTLEMLTSLRSRLGSHHLISVKAETLWAKAELSVLENKIKIETWINYKILTIFSIRWQLSRLSRSSFLMGHPNPQ